MYHFDKNYFTQLRDYYRKCENARNACENFFKHYKIIP